jgi:hypothetical protein
MGTSNIDWANDDIRAGLLIAGTTTPEDKDKNFVTQIVADEAVDGSYGRIVIPNIVTTENDANDRDEITSDPWVFPLLDGDPITHVFLFKQVTNDADSPILCVWPISYTPSGVDLTITPLSSGFLRGVQVTP